MTTAAPDLPDYTAGQQPVTVPTVIGDFTITALDVSPIIDASAFEAVAVVQTFGSARALEIVQLVRQSGALTPSLGSVITTAGNVVVPISGGLLQIENLDPALTADLTVIGLGRSGLLAAGTVAGWSAEVLNLALPSTVMVANTSYPFPAPTNGQLFQGPAYANFQLSGVTATGLWRVRTAAGGVMILADTSETHTSPNGNRAVYKPCAFPANVNEFDFLCNVAGTASGTIQAVPNY